MSSFSLVPLSLLILVSLASAQTQATLPLGPVYRPGRMLPVQISVARPDVAQPTWLMLASPGAITTSLPVHKGQASVVAPWLIIDAPSHPTIAFGKESQELQWPPLRPLARDECIVGVATDDQAAGPLVQKLHPGRRVVSVRLDTANPLPGSADAWESLDLLMLDSASFAAAGMGRLADLLAGGTTIVVRADSPPDARWPWEAIDGWQVLRHAPRGPRELVYDTDMSKVYRPVVAWNAQWPAEFRRRIMLYGLAVAIGLLAISLLRWRLMPVLALAGSAAAVAGLYFWWSFVSPVQQRSGQIMVIGPGLVQRDTWIYQGAVERTQTTTRWMPNLRPLFVSPGHMKAMGMTLACREDGSPDYYTYRVPARGKIALVARSVGPQAPRATPAQAQPSPLLDLLPLYSQSGDKVGQLPGTPVPRGAYQDSEWWPTLVLTR